MRCRTPASERVDKFSRLIRDCLRIVKLSLHVPYIATPNAHISTPCIQMPPQMITMKHQLRIPLRRLVYKAWKLCSATPDDTDSPEPKRHHHRSSARNPAAANPNVPADASRSLRTTRKASDALAPRRSHLRTTCAHISTPRIPQRAQQTSESHASAIATSRVPTPHFRSVEMVQRDARHRTEHPCRAVAREARPAQRCTCACRRRRRHQHHHAARLNRPIPAPRCGQLAVLLRAALNSRP